MSDELKAWLDDKTYLMNTLLDMGADVVEVVRCKDCKFWDSDCRWCDLWGDTQGYDDGYCSYGERKGE